jgi:hypothetical protein
MGEDRQYCCNNFKWEIEENVFREHHSYPGQFYMLFLKKRKTTLLQMLPYEYISEDQLNLKFCPFCGTKLRED